MINSLQEKYFKTLSSPYFTEKSLIEFKKNNLLVIKVDKNATKKTIKIAMFKLFKITIKNVRTLIVKNKIKYKKSYKTHSYIWKKAYITLQKSKNLNFLKKSLIQYRKIESINENNKM